VKPTVWRDAIRDSTLDATAKAVAWTLSTYMNGRGEAWPSKNTLAVGASKSKRAVDGAIVRITRAGYLDVSQSKGRSSNRYQAKLPTLQAVARLTVQADAPLEVANPADRGTSTLQESTLNPAGIDTPTLQLPAPESEGESVFESEAESGARAGGSQESAAARASAPDRLRTEDWGTANCTHKGCSGLERCQYEDGPRSPKVGLGERLA
jgi:hypothetical protein